MKNSSTLPNVDAHLPTCPKCKKVIPPEDFNVSTDLAFCRSCGVTHRFSELLENRSIDDTLEQVTPIEGTWQKTTPTGVVVGASHRSMAGALGYLAICLFWNGIVSVFVLINLASTLRLLGLHLPEWFPAPQMNGETMGWGMTLFLWIFLTPFLLVGSFLIGTFLMSLAGRCEIAIDPNQATVFKGIGPLGFKKRFDPSLVTKVDFRRKKWTNSESSPEDNQEICIELNTGKEIRCGSGLKMKRKQYLAATLRKILLQR